MAGELRFDPVLADGDHVWASNCHMIMRFPNTLGLPVSPNEERERNVRALLATVARPAKAGPSIERGGIACRTLGGWQYQAQYIDLAEYAFPAGSWSSADSRGRHVEGNELCGYAFRLVEGRVVAVVCSTNQRAPS